MNAGNQLHLVDLERGDYRNPYPKGFGPVTVPEGNERRLLSRSRGHRGRVD